MAVYTFSIIETNLIGNTDVTIQESTSNGMADLIASIGNEKYILKTVKVWSSNIDQLNQPITVTERDINGNIKIKTEIPNIDSYSYISKMTFSEKHELSEDTEIEYTVLANTTLKITFGVDDSPDVTANLSNVKILEKASGKGHLWDVINKSNLIYKQEDSDFTEENLDKYYDSQLIEPEEQVVEKIGPANNEEINEGQINSDGISNKIISHSENKSYFILDNDNHIILTLAITAAIAGTLFIAYKLIKNK